MSDLKAKHYGTLALLAVLVLLAILVALRVSPWATLFPLFLALFVYIGHLEKVKRVMEEKGARSLGLISSPEPELPAAPLLPEGEPKVYKEYRGEVLGRPFRRFEVQVYGARRFGTVAYRFTGVLYEVELFRPFPLLHLAPRGWPTYPRERWPFLLAFLGLSGTLLALLTRHLTGLPVLKPGTSPLLLLVFPALYLYLLAAWRVATREAGPEVALEGELAQRFRAWGEMGSIRQDALLGRVLLEMGRSRRPFWLRVEGEKLYLAFPENFFFSAHPLLPFKRGFARKESQFRWELKALEGLLRALDLGDEDNGSPLR